MSLKGNSAEERSWNYLMGKIGNAYGVAGLMGNLKAESGIIFNRVEVLCLNRLRENGKVYTDATYTSAVDNGKITRAGFLNPLPNKQYGYGLCQWTSPGRKAGLYDLCKQRKVSIADEQAQLDFLILELTQTYKTVMSTLKTAKTIRAASDIVLKKFECPANTGISVQLARTKYGEEIYDKYANGKKGENSMSVASIIENAISWMEKTANNNSHGYDQIYRWGEKGDYDCSSAVITSWQNAGVPVKTNGATYTGNMYSVFRKCGFVDVTSSVNLATGAGLQRGDVLLNTIHHTAMFCGNGKEVEASINEKGTATGGTPGDQTGKEFLVRSYRNYPWNVVLRYTGGQTVTPTTSSSSTVLRKGSTGTAVKTLQKNLNTLIKAGLTVDGSFGTNTYNAVIKFQKQYGLIADGEVGTQTQSKISTLLKKPASNTTQSTSSQKVGEVTASKLSVRKWYGFNENNERYDLIVSYPYLAKGNRVAILATYNSNNEIWYKVAINNSATKNKDVIGFICGKCADGTYVKIV